MYRQQRQLAISGWAQPIDALISVTNEDCHHFDYHNTLNLHEALLELKNVSTVPWHTCIGWSLGGVLLMHAVAQGIIRTQQLVLLGAPFQFVSCERFTQGMDPLTFELFHANYRTDAVRTAKRFAALISHGDQHSERILGELPHYPDNANQELWLPWLDVLKNQTTHHLDFSHFPPTLILHGQNDKIVSHAQAELLATLIPYATLRTLPNCGHAPHLHNPAFVRSAIQEHLQHIPFRHSQP